MLGCPPDILRALTTNDGSPSDCLFVVTSTGLDATQ